MDAAAGGSVATGGGPEGTMLFDRVAGRLPDAPSFPEGFAGVFEFRAVLAGLRPRPVLGEPGFGLIGGSGIPTNATLL